MKSIAVCGQGFVGGSLTTVFAERGFDVFTFDVTGKQAPGGKHPPRNGLNLCPVSSVNELVRICEIQTDFSGVYFVCLPTPMYDDGECDTSIVEGVLKELSEIPGKRIAVVKSTVPPGSTERWNKQFEGTGLRVIHSPEFLTEANALDDMRNQNRIILGGPRPYINVVKQVFQKAFPKVPIVKTSSTTSEMVKYFTNIHLMARVVLSCEFSQLCDALSEQGHNVDYDEVVQHSCRDPRLGMTHMNVPGIDGIAGARGHCFPKDINSLISLAKKLNVKSTVMNAVWEKNLDVVPPEHRDWEKMLGRATSKRK